MDIKSEEQKQIEDRERIQRFTLMDDVMMRVAFRDDIPLTEFVLRIILGMNDLKVIKVNTQYDMKRLLGRSITLDVLATDSNGILYNIEIQKAKKGAKPKRARYHSAAIDVQLLDTEEDFDKLPETYVIFFAENDIKGHDKPVYLFDRWDTDDNCPLNDGTHIMYVNGEYTGDTDIAKLIHDFRCQDADDVYFPNIADKIRECKGTAEGVDRMNQTLKDVREDEREQEALKFALRLLKHGKDNVEEIATLANISIDEVKALAEKYNISVVA